MAGRGPAPKDPARRARSNADPVATTVLRHQVVKPPALPKGLRTPEVRRWWNVWRSSPQAEHFGSTDWLFLLETAYLAKAFYDGDVKVAAELRLRVAKFGATPEDRARLRMQFAQADEADARRPAAAAGSRERYGDLRVLQGGGVAVGADEPGPATGRG